MASAQVKVYCKLPNGIQYTLPNGRRLVLNGFYGRERSPLQLSGMPGRDTVAGFGVTTVDAQDWEQVVKLHGKSAAHENGLIYAAKDEKSGEAQAADQQDKKSGLEPYDPSKHPEDATQDGTLTDLPTA